MRYYKEILNGRGSKLPEFSSLDFHLKLAGEGILYRKPENRKKELSFAECLVKFANDRSSFRDFYLDGLMEKIAKLVPIKQLMDASKAVGSTAKNVGEKVSYKGKRIKSKSAPSPKTKRQTSKTVNPRVEITPPVVDPNPYGGAFGQFQDPNQPLFGVGSTARNTLGAAGVNAPPPYTPPLTTPGVTDGGPASPGFFENLKNYYNQAKTNTTEFLNTKATPFINDLSEGLAKGQGIPGLKPYQQTGWADKFHKILDAMHQQSAKYPLMGAIGNFGKNFIQSTGIGLGQKPIGWKAPLFGLSALALGNNMLSSFKDQRPFMTPPMYG